MKVITMSRFGGPDVLELAQSELPNPRAGEVRIRVETAGVVYTDVLMRAGAFSANMTLPIVPGSEVAGIIDAVGDDVGDFLPGDRVAAPLFLHWLTGGYAEYAIAPAASLIKLPDHISTAQATALMVQGFTALRLSQRFVMKGKRVFIHAAGGGVGSLLVQLARHQGARMVFAGASETSKLQSASQHAGLHLVNYSQPGWIEEIKTASPDGVDILFDSAGSAVSEASQSLLAPSGKLVVYGMPTLSSLKLGAAEISALSMANQSISGFSIMPLMTPDALRLSMNELFELVRAGHLKPVIGRKYAFEEAAEAHRDIESRRTSGKLLLVPSSS